MEHTEILEKLTSSYRINFNDIQLLREGGCVSYCVLSGSRRYFMKIIPSAFMDTAKQSLDIIRFLERKGFPAPRIIPTNDGALYTQVNEQNDKTIWVLFEYIDGTEPEERDDITSIGALVGQLHNTMKEYQGFLPTHGKDFFIDRYINILRLKEYDSKKLEVFKEYGDALWSRVENLPRGFCHGDLHLGNLLRTPAGNYYLLDFDTSCHSFPAYDIMVICNATNYFDYHDNGYDKTKKTVDEFLKGYTKYNTISEMEYKALFDLIAVYHYQLQATIIEIFGLNCVDHEFLDKQLNWLLRWREQCEREIKGI